MVYHGLVAENIKLPGHNGDEIEAYLARPSGGERYPGVVVIHHLPGWDAWTREVVRKLAEAGYAAISPHLFSRWGPGDPSELAARARPSFGPSDTEAMGDIAASARYLKAQPFSNGRVGCIGFCSGGRQAYLAASQVPELDAAVDCWGGEVIPGRNCPQDDRHPVSPFDATGDIRMPVLGIFGNDDQYPTPDEVDQIEAALKEHDKTYEFHRYDGAGHGFFAVDRAGYRPVQAVDAWNKVFDFFAKHLQAPVAQPATG